MLQSVLLVYFVLGSRTARGTSKAHPQCPDIANVRARVDAIMARPSGIGRENLQCTGPLSLPFLDKSLGFALVVIGTVPLPSGFETHVVACASRQNAIPGDNECTPVGLMGTLVSGTVLIAGEVRRNGTCGWIVTFTQGDDAVPPDAEVHITHVEWGGNEEPWSRVQPVKDSMWEGQPLDHEASHVGSKQVTCEDRCAMHGDACAAWAIDGNVTGPGSWYASCRLFASVERRVPRNGSQSGDKNVYSTGIIPAHTAGLNGVGRQWLSPEESPCRHLAHVLGSPLPPPPPLPLVRPAATKAATRIWDAGLPCDGSWKRESGNAEWVWTCLHTEPNSRRTVYHNRTETIYFWGDSIMLSLQRAALAKLGGQAISGKVLGKEKHPRDGRILVRWLNVWGSQRDRWHTFGNLFEGDGEPSALVGNFGLLHEMLKQRLNDTDAYFSDFAFKFEMSRPRNLQQLIFVTPPALHKFRQPFCTQARARSFGHAVSQRLSAKWTTFNLELMTRGRPDGSKDGMHYQENIMAAVASELLSHLGVDTAT